MDVGYIHIKMTKIDSTFEKYYSSMSIKLLILSQKASRKML